MRNSLILFAFVVILAGCGGGNDDPAPQASTPAAEEEHTEDGKVHEPDLAGASEGVKKYYGDAHVDQGGDESADVEAEYHQPPQPPVVGLGETITLTGSNIGIRQEVTLDRVKRAGNRTEVTLSLENTGIAVYEAPLQNASLTYAGGKTVPADPRKSCSAGLDPAYLRMDVGQDAEICLEFETDGDKAPEEFVLALEQVPTEAGGIWNLR